MDNLESDLIFQCLKRIIDDNTKQLNNEMIEYCNKHEIINDWEYGFSTDTLRKRKLTGKQLRMRQKIADKIIKELYRYH